MFKVGIDDRQLRWNRRWWFKLAGQSARRRESRRYDDRHNVNIRYHQSGQGRHREIAGHPKKYDWIPQPAEIRQLCRDKQAQRENSDKPKLEKATYSADNFASPEECERMAAKANSVISELAEMKNSDKDFNYQKWVKWQIESGTIKLHPNDKRPYPQGGFGQ